MNVTRYKCSVLAVDDDPGVLSVLAGQLGANFELVTACTAEQARGVLSRRSVDMVLSDLQLPDGTGLALLDWVRRASPRTCRILLTGTARLQDAADAVNQTQVHRLVLKPWRGEDLLQTLRAASSTLLLERAHEELLDQYRRLTQGLEERVAARTRELEAALEELRETNRILREMALTDPLTGLPNRRAIDQIARNELARRARTPGPLALALVDADHFGQVNKTYTLNGGDHVLTWLAGVLQNSIRGGADSLGRVGGEEFLVVAPGTDAAGAARLAERLRAAVEAGVTVYNGHPIRMTISLGVGVAEDGVGAGFDQLRECAAAALKEAKEAGRNRAVVRPLAPPRGDEVNPG